MRVSAIWPSRREHKWGLSSVIYLLFCSKCKYFREIILCSFIFLPLLWKKKSCENTGVFVELFFFFFVTNKLATNVFCFLFLNMIGRNSWSGPWWLQHLSWEQCVLQEYMAGHHAHVHAHTHTNRGNWQSTYWHVIGRQLMWTSGNMQNVTGLP